MAPDSVGKIACKARAIGKAVLAILPTLRAPIARKTHFARQVDARGQARYEVL
jgi:hypothetical protein